MQSLQAVLAEHRTQAEDAARALSATEARLDEMEAKLQGASEAQRDAETLRDQVDHLPALTVALILNEKSQLRSLLAVITVTSY